jgi:uncharacterized protein YqeY
MFMNLEEKLQADLLESMKAGNKEKTEALRAVKAEITKERTKEDFSGELTDNDILKIMQKMCKEREESAEIYQKNGRDDLANVELSEKKYISSYLPKQATEKEVEAVVKSVICEIGANSMKDMGRVIKAVSYELGSRPNGKTISEIVKRNLNK